jgi:hypothetical protein
LKEKVDTIKTLDAEIVELIEDETELAYGSPLSLLFTITSSSEVEKFNYLNSLLEISAREAVTGLA